MKPKILSRHLERHFARRPASWKHPVSENGREAAFLGSEFQLVFIGTGGRWTRHIPLAFSKMLSFLLTSEIKSEECLPCLSLPRPPQVASTVHFPPVSSSEKRASLSGASRALLLFAQPPSPAPRISHQPSAFLSTDWHLHLDPSAFYIPFTSASSYPREAILSHLGSSPSASISSFH